ncbi:MAG: hypothetical protein AAF211_07065 [Myxococcota bacterium]
MKCDFVRAALERHDPADEIPDEIVEHIDACPACRAHLDACFPPVTRRDLQPVERRAAGSGGRDGDTWWRAPVGVAAVAAAMALVVGGRVPSERARDARLAMLDTTEICVVVWEPPECEFP